MNATTTTNSPDHDTEANITEVELTTGPDSRVADVGNADAMRTLRRRRRLGLVAAAIALFAALLLTAAPAGAVATASTGAWAHSSGYCGGRTVTVSTSATQFEWRRVAIYVNGQYTGVTGWEKLSVLSSTRGVYFANSQTSVWVQYADDLGGGRFAYASEWMRFSNGNYTCVAW